jgi:hypothetical protein
MAAFSSLSFYALAASCLSLIALPITRVSAQTAPLVLHLPTAQPLDTVQAASPGVKITQIYNGSPTITMWSAETPLTIAGGEAGCSFTLPIAHMSIEDVVLVTPPTANNVVTRLEIARSNNMSAAQALSAAIRIDRRLESVGWKPAPNVDRNSPARALRLLQRDFEAEIVDLRCGHAEILVSISSDPRHPKNATWRFIYDMQPKPELLLAPRPPDLPSKSSAVH